mgnify:CR=1 FL=1
MAAPTLDASVELMNWPMLVRKLTLTSGTTATALAHGGPAVKPDIVLLRQASAGPTASDAAAYSPTTTQVTFDFEDEGNDTFECYCIWVSQAAGGITVP